MNEDVMYFKDDLFEKLIAPRQNFDYKDKHSIIKTLIFTMLNRTSEMFEWKGLPTTIPQRVIETQLQTIGYTVIFKHKDHMFSTYATIGGHRNYNFLPTKAIVSNPYIDNKSFQLKIYYGEDDYEMPMYKDIHYDGDCVVIPNDTNYIGLIPLSKMYASEIAETKITKNVLMTNARAMYIFACANDDEKDAFDTLMKNLEEGKVKSIVTNDLLVESKTLQFADNALRDFTDLIENEQYAKASWFNDVGLQANYNMKREAINSNESQLNKDAIIPLTDNMLKMRKLHCEHINKLFGVNWSVDFSSAWKATRQAMEEALENVDPNSEMEEKPTEIGSDENPTEIGSGGVENENTTE